MEKQMTRDDIPNWAKRAEEVEYKPNWVDAIPRTLWSLGEVFFPIPRGKKGWNYPHNLDSHRFSATSEELNAYFEQGWGYGIACSGDLVVIDIDDLRFLDEIVDKLPETSYQWSGSREGVHLFYICEGVTKRRTLKVEAEFPHRSPAAYDTMWGEEEDSIHIGELKADSNGYVVGPGSVHPSGNTYGPLKGDEITEIEIEELADVVIPYISKSSRNGGSDYNPPEDYGEHGNKSVHDFYELTPDDVLPWLESEKRISHPVHGSETGMNFMKNGDGETFTCWRCDYGAGQGCGLNANQYLAIEAIGSSLGSNACEKVRSNWDRDSTLHYHAWREAVRKGLISSDRPPYTVIKGFMVEKGALEESQDISSMYEAKQLLEYEMASSTIDRTSI